MILFPMGGKVLVCALYDVLGSGWRCILPRILYFLSETLICAFENCFSSFGMFYLLSSDGSCPTFGHVPTIITSLIAILRNRIFKIDEHCVWRRLYK